MKNLATNKSVIITTLLAILAIVLISAVLITQAGDGGNNTRLQSNQLQNSQQQNNTAKTAVVTETTQTQSTAGNTNTSQSLLYLVEEEKLAHDVYDYFYTKYGVRIFSNISSSEISHQNKILDLMQSRNIADPRTGQAGTFANQDLQNLYNQLIEQGNISVTEAYKVGVAIEELDIKDLQQEIDKTTDTEIKTVLISLKSASQKHLNAFNSHL